MILYEYRSTVQRRHAPILLPKQGLQGKPGFRSVLGFPEQTVAFIKENNNTQGLDTQDLYLNHIVLDFDNNDAAYENTIQVCLQKNWTFNAFTTGNRGYHIYVITKEYCEKYIYWQARQWAEEHFHGFDKALFTPSSMTRIPGTTHAKTGKRMVQVRNNKGLMPDIKQTKITRSMPKIAPEEEDPLNFVFMLNRSKTEGTGRHTYAFTLVNAGLRSGTPPQKIIEFVETWNQTRCLPPLKSTYLNRMYRNILGV